MLISPSLASLVKQRPNRTQRIPLTRLRYRFPGNRWRALSRFAQARLLVGLMIDKALSERDAGRRISIIPRSNKVWRKGGGRFVAKVFFYPSDTMVMDKNLSSVFGSIFKRSTNKKSTKNRKRTLNPTFESHELDPFYRPGEELLSVAYSTLDWWEKHKNDKVTVDGLVNYRYEFKPPHVSQAEEIVRKAQPDRGMPIYLNQRYRNHEFLGKVLSHPISLGSRYSNRNYSSDWDSSEAPFDLLVEG